MLTSTPSSKSDFTMSLIPHTTAPHSRTVVSYSNTPIYGFTTCTQHQRVMVYSKYTATLNMSLWLYQSLKWQLVIVWLISRMADKTKHILKYLFNGKPLTVYSNVPTVNEWPTLLQALLNASCDIW